MKFIIKQVLIVVALISIIHESKCDYEFSKYRLSRVYENLIENNNKEYKDEIENEISRAYDMNCVKNFYKLPQNSNMMVHQVEEMILDVATGMKCSDEDKIFERHLNEFCRKSSRIKLSCIKSRLQQLEPTSNLVENFEISEADRQECDKSLPTKDVVYMQQKFESKLGPLNVYTCGAVSENGANDFMKFYTKGVLINYGNITEELKKSEKQKLKEYLKDISIRTVNCIIKRYEDDPQGRLYS